MEQLLTNLQSPNAALREPAEKQLNELAAQPEPFLAELVRVMLQSPDPTVRHGARTRQPGRGGRQRV